MELQTATTRDYKLSVTVKLFIAHVHCVVVIG